MECEQKLFSNTEGDTRQKSALTKKKDWLKISYLRRNIKVTEMFTVETEGN